MASTHQSAENTTTFGKNYAVLNLDLMTILINAVKESIEGQRFISNCSLWNDEVHKRRPLPLTIFTSLYFEPGQPELVQDAPFTQLVNSFDSFTAGSSEVQIASAFTVDVKDIVLQKNRWYAGAGNNLEQILKARNIDTVIISGLSLSGVVMSTVYRLFDLDYKIYVISDNVLELPVEHNAEFSKILLDMLMPKMSLRAITLNEALHMLQNP